MTLFPSFTADEKRRLRALLDKELVEDGDYVGFDLALWDSAPSRRNVFINDSDPHAWARNVRDAAHAAQLDPAPCPTVPNVTDAALSTRTPIDHRAMRDAARAAQWG